MVSDTVGSRSLSSSRRAFRAGHVGLLDHERHGELALVRDQLVPDLHLLSDALLGDDALGAEHFLELVEHGEPVLEEHRDERPTATRRTSRAARYFFWKSGRMRS